MYKRNLLLALLLTVIFGTISAQRPRVCLVLGGGGAKGFAHIPVLELIEEMNIPVDMVIGVSSGAIVGGLYAAGYSPQMIKDALLNLNWTSLFLDAPSLPFENELNAGNILLRYSNESLQRGLSPGQNAYNLFKTLTAKIPSYINFDTLSIPFRAGVVTVPEGTVELIGEGDLAEAIRASISLPGVFDPFYIDGKLYIDGGTLDNLPIRLAREMGYDIIIASELFPGLESINISPREVPELMLDLYFNTVSKEQYPLADALLKANAGSFSIMDFHKSKEIYTLAANEKEKMRAGLEKVSEAVLSRTENSPPRSSGSYRELPAFIPVSLNIRGALDRDRVYIEKYFSRLIRGKALESANLEDFIRRIYRTDNYRSAAVRINTRQGNTEMELILYPKDFKGIGYFLGGNYQGILSENIISKVSLQSGVQFQGLSGPGSVLLLNMSFLDLLSFGILYLQPLSPETFITARAEITLDKDIVVSGFKIKEPEEHFLFLITGELMGGFVIDRSSTFKAGLLFFANPKEYPDGTDGRNTVLGLSASYAFNTLDYGFMPSAGIYAEVENRLYFPLPFGNPVFFDLLSLDFRGILPIGGSFGVVAQAFAGADLSANLSRLEELPAGFTAFDRQYFPNVYQTVQYYSYKAAASLAIQFLPLKNVPIFGGQLITSLSFSAGELFNELDSASYDNVIWNASCNIGLRLKNNFGLLLRLGAGYNGSGSVMPFLAFDIGQIKRSGIKP